MTEETIREFLNQMKNRRYTVGVLHISPPQWLEDIKDLMTCVEFLLNELKNK
jgi:hypothetical protein